MNSLQTLGLVICLLILAGVLLTIGLTGMIKQSYQDGIADGKDEYSQKLQTNTKYVCTNWTEGIVESNIKISVNETCARNFCRDWCESTINTYDGYGNKNTFKREVCMINCGADIIQTDSDKSLAKLIGCQIINAKALRLKQECINGYFDINKPMGEFPYIERTKYIDIDASEMNISVTDEGDMYLNVNTNLSLNKLTVNLN